MQIVHIKSRAINLDLVSHCEVQARHDTASVKVLMTGTANNTPGGAESRRSEEALEVMEYVAEKPVSPVAPFD